MHGYQPNCAFRRFMKQEPSGALVVKEPIATAEGALWHFISPYLWASRGSGSAHTWCLVHTHRLHSCSECEHTSHKAGQADCTPASNRTMQATLEYEDTFRWQGGTALFQADADHRYENLPSDLHPSRPPPQHNLNPTFKMAAVSSISAMKVETPRVWQSPAPTRANTASRTESRADSAATKQPTCAISTATPTWTWQTEGQDFS